MSVTRDFYLARAADSARNAAEATLSNVRERSLRAEAAWRGMADKLGHVEQLREASAKKQQQEQPA